MNVTTLYSLLTIQLLHNTEIKDVALHYSKSPSQLLLRWAVQQGIGLWCIIPYMEPSNMHTLVSITFGALQCNGKL